MRAAMMAISGVLSVLAAIATPVHAATVADPTGDFLPSYVGPKLADLDVTKLSVNYDPIGDIFTIDTLFAGAIDSGSLGFYVFGVDTGKGAIKPFAAIGEPNVIFDQAIVIFKNGTGLIGPVSLDPSAITIAGNELTFDIAGSLLPSTGFTPDHYGFNLWPRIGFANNSQITDFAPDNATLAAAVPEPTGWAMLIVGFGVIGAMVRSRRRDRRLALS